MADTEDTTTLQNEIDKLKETKANIKQALIDMNQTVADTDTFNSYATKIKNISSDTTATANDITSGKTAYINGEKVIGTMPAIKGVVNYDTVDLLKADTTQKANTIGIVQTINENNEITDVLVYKFDGTNWVSMGIDGGVLTNEEYINSTNTANTILGETTSTSTDTETTNIDTTTNS